ncbi:low molecular weight protein arginine phosphatase [Paenalkalicoccus suaedae]|uniref:Low molecular weight protein arginine phosphatase n=1 Tax=Paenalkalicoccus suaedae TaxID=2592382 RepID=A0A859FI35_9BACI|nr:low molecular weight protein arginine phosphatase [Paenalkalicoccus suaedae]QKS72761.1 low molecular weight protein arginine phosphatase [Paenalkalicoccus suaedae]
MERVLFVCTGNTCRSPMAEVIFENKKQNEDFRAQSAGVHGMEGMPMSEGSRQVLARRGMMESHQSQGVSPDLLEWSDLTLAMTNAHKQMLIEQYPTYADQIFTLKEYVLDDSNTLQKIEELREHHVQMELKRAQFVTANQDKIERYNETNDMNNQNSKEEELLEQLHPHQVAIDRIEWDLPSFDIQDPFGGDDAQYEATYKEMEEAITKLLAKLEKGEG